MVGIGAVKVSTRPNARQDWLAVKNRDAERFLVKVTLPRDALFRSILDDQGSVHPARLTFEVFPLAFVGVDFPSRTTSAA
jgi:hypothetical protein